MNRGDTERLELLDRLAERVPEINLDEQALEWRTLPGGGEGLHIGNGGDYFANRGEDLHAYGSLDPLIPGFLGCIAIYPDGSRGGFEGVVNRVSQGDCSSNAPMSELSPPTAFGTPG